MQRTHLERTLFVNSLVMSKSPAISLEAVCLMAVNKAAVSVEGGLQQRAVDVLGPMDNAPRPYQPVVQYSLITQHGHQSPQSNGWQRFEWNS